MDTSKYVVEFKQLEEELSSAQNDLDYYGSKFYYDQKIIELQGLKDQKK